MDLSNARASHFLLFVCNEHRLGEAGIRLLLISKGLLFNSGRVIVQFRLVFVPVEEEHALLAVGSKLVRVLGVELYPVLVLKLMRVFELQRRNWAVKHLVHPVPQGDGLWFIISQRDNVLLVR